MRNRLFVLCAALGCGTNLMAATLCSGNSAAVKVDQATGARIAAASEAIRYSAAWETTASGATAVVAVNGATLKSATGTGSVTWTPTRNGTYTLTHKVMNGSTQVGSTLEATFVVSSMATEDAVTGGGGESVLGAFSSDGASHWALVSRADAKVGTSCLRGGLDEVYDETRSATYYAAKLKGPGTFAFSWKTSCDADPAGEFTWDHAEFWVDGVLEACCDGITDWRDIEVTITGDGVHEIKWVYVTDGYEPELEGTEDCVLIDDVSWSGESYSEPLAPLVDPVITPGDGTTFASETCEVTISCATPDVVIYYSTNGRTPGTTDAYRYTGTFTIDKTTIVTAVAVRGEEKSAYVKAVITKNVPVRAETETTAVPVPYVWLKEKFPSMGETSSEYEAKANATAANGRKVWECFLAGLDPSDPTSDFKVDIAMRDGKVCVSWTPDLNEKSVTRIYTLFGRRDLNKGAWETPIQPTHQFFKVRVTMPTGSDGETSSVPGEGFVPWDSINYRYCIIDLSAGPDATSYPVTYLAAEPDGGFNVDEYKTTKLVLKCLEAGSFIMGKDQTDQSHKVTLTKPFFMGLFEVTQKQWTLVMGSNPSSSYGVGDAYPVHNVPYSMIRGSTEGAKWPSSAKVDASSFLGKLQARTGLNFDLPTEAQWEYACRAGTTTTYSYGDSASGDYMWYYSNSSSSTHEVGTKKPNPWGLYDMHGNVWEWNLDWYGSLTYGTDPKGSASGSYRVIRGGGWIDYASICTSSFRYNINPSVTDDNIGFRLSRTLP